MIDLETVWIPQIIRYARLIAEQETLRRSWMEGDRSQTSVTGFDELIEQVFEDLDAETLVEEAQLTQDLPPELIVLISGFLGTLSAFDKIRDVRPELKAEAPSWALPNGAASKPPRND